MCALHEHEHTHQEALNKSVKYKFCGIKGVVDGNFYPEGESPLQAGWKLCQRNSCGDIGLLVSCKLVWGDPSSEGSRTTKVGTDEQKPHTEATYGGQGNTSYQRLQPTTIASRCGRD